MALEGTLGTGTYTARIIDRITGNAVATNTLLRMTFSRRRDSSGIGTAQFSSDGDKDCCAEMGWVRSWRHELELTRDPGGLVFIGPITSIEDTKNLFNVTASDRTVWLDYRFLRGVETLTDDPSTILKIVLGKALNDYDPIPIKTRVLPTGKTATVSWDYADRKTASATLNDLLASYLDVTMVGDTLFAGATTVESGARANLSEEDFAADLTGTEDGKFLATILHARGANGLVTTYPPQMSDFSPNGDAYYGIIEQSTDFSDIYNLDDLVVAARGYWSTHRLPPFRAKVPGGSRLSSNAPIDFGWLIPGAQVNMSLANVHCREGSELYEIDTVDVSAGAGGGGTPRAASGQFVSASDAASEQVQIGLVAAVR